MLAKPKALAVDDERLNLEILEMHLDEGGFETVLAEDGQIALQRLDEHPDIDVILLDRMMPNMDGITCLHHIKAHEKWREIPVVMQTAAAATGQVLQGLQAGVYYYLTKPYDERVLLGILGAALSEAKNKRQLREQITRQSRVFGLIENATFRFRTLDEAKSLATGLGCCFPDFQKAAFGLHELLINAIEHGNLGITYAEKSDLVLRGVWMKEVERRLEDPKYKDREGRLTCSATKDAVTIHIKDAGAGFDWKRYIELSPERAFDLHGRGIFAARQMCFDSVEFVGCGNEVIAKVLLNG